MKQFIYYKQTTPYTCGPVDIMIALAEFYGAPVSQEHEMEIYEETKNSIIKYLGSFPAKLLNYLSKHCDDVTFFLPAKFNFKNIYLPLRWAFHLLVKLHEIFVINKMQTNYTLDKYKYKKKETLISLAQRLIKNKNCYAIIAIAKKYELHYLLIRSDENDNIVVMDSGRSKEEEKNDYYSADDFVDSFKVCDTGCYIFFNKRQKHD